jgi:tRNA nucleotidyltransferase (CCA-adding enzyme)
MKINTKEQKILKKVLKKITPEKKQEKKQLEFAKKLIEKIKATKGPHVDAELVGSAARGTHLAGDNDLDIFVFYPPEIPREKFENHGIALGKQIFKRHEWELAYSEHPYVRGIISGYKVEIIPTYKIDTPTLMKSAVDRSPFHNNYLKEKLTPQLCNETRLLKQFMKGIKCYGADLSMNSFPGYVAELLIIKYGSFIDTLKAASNWKKNQVIDIENAYTEEEAIKKFGSHHFIIIDPVDINRNVAAALSEQQYARFISASRKFLEKPSYKFFFQNKHKPWHKKRLKKYLDKTEIVAIKFKYPKKVIEDQMWGQLKKLAKKITAMAKEQEFNVKRHGEWLKKDDIMIIILEVESKKLQKARIRTGPEVFDAENSKAFLETHKKPFSGPRIENTRWVVEIERKYTNIEDYITKLLEKFKKEEKEDLRKAITKGTKIMNEKEITKLYTANNEFSKFLTTFLKGKEEFLEY